MRVCDPNSLPNILQFTSGNEAGPVMRLLRCGMQGKKLGFSLSAERKNLVAKELSVCHWTVRPNFFQISPNR